MTNGTAIAFRPSGGSQPLTRLSRHGRTRCRSPQFISTPATFEEPRPEGWSETTMLQRKWALTHASISSAPNDGRAKCLADGCMPGTRCRRAHPPGCDRYAAGTRAAVAVST
jgi:hypothetical protein